MEKEAKIRQFLWDMAMWDFGYRAKHVQNKPEKELLTDGWEQDCEGNWCHQKMEKARERAFRERNRGLTLKFVEGNLGYSARE